MSNLITVIISVFGYIIIGYIIGKSNFFSKKYLKIFDKISFNILLPLSLISNFWLIKFPEIIINELLISFFGSGIIIFIISFLIGKKIYEFKTDDCAIFGLGSCFGNSVAFGIPLMYSILDPVKVMPYMILVLFHGMIHFTYTTLIIETYRNRLQSNSKRIFKTILGLAQNIVLFGMFIGFFLNFMNIPFPEKLQNVLIPVSKVALPAILISLGIALSGFQIAKNLKYSLILTLLKNFLHPLIAFIFAKYILMMSPLLIFIVTIAAALPSGSQTYYFSYRYNSLQKIISANVVISTFVSFFTISFLLVLLNY